MKNVITNTYSYLALLCSLLLLSACATTAETKAASVEERATARWKALLSDDLAGAYEFLSPGYRSSVTSVQYQRNILLQRVQWTDAEIRGSECTDNTCTVSSLLSYRVVGALPGVRSFRGKKDVKESWVRVDDMWYLVP
jgi:hypothetical protein